MLCVIKSDTVGGECDLYFLYDVKYAMRFIL